MSGSTKIVSLCALAIVLMAIVASRPCCAAESDAKLKATAHAAAVEAEAAEHESGDPNPLAFSTDLAIWTLVVFVVLIGRGLGWIVRSAHIQQGAVAVIRQHGACFMTGSWKAAGPRLVRAARCRIG